LIQKFLHVTKCRLRDKECAKAFFQSRKIQCKWVEVIDKCGFRPQICQGTGLQSPVFYHWPSRDAAFSSCLQIIKHMGVYYLGKEFKAWTEPLTWVSGTQSNAVHAHVVMPRSTNMCWCAHANRKHESYKFLHKENNFFPNQKKTHLIINFLTTQLNNRGFTKVSRCQLSKPQQEVRVLLTSKMHSGKGSSPIQDAYPFGFPSFKM